MAIPDFEDWYISNKSFYNVKHSGNKEKMRDDALRAYHQIKQFDGKPAMQVSAKKEKNKKPNPYGFD